MKQETSLKRERAENRVSGQDLEPREIKTELLNFVMVQVLGR